MFNEIHDGDGDGHDDDDHDDENHDDGGEAEVEVSDTPLEAQRGSGFHVDNDQELQETPVQMELDTRGLVQGREGVGKTHSLME